MKKRLLSLAIALALCLGLAVPVMAVDTSGLDAKGADAYAQVLGAEISKRGIRAKEYERGIIYAGLVDMDADGTPELFVFDADEACLEVRIWSIKDGSAVETGSYESSNYIYDGKIAFARKNGQVCLFLDGEWAHSSLFYRTYGRNLCYVGKNGPINDYSVMYSDGIENEDEEFPEMEDVSSISYDKSWAVDSVPLLTCNYYWESGKEHTVRELQEALSEKAKSTSSTFAAAPTASVPVVTAATTGTYAPYTIRSTTFEGPCTITFSAAKVERKTIQIRNFSDIEGGIYGPYEAKTVTMVTLQPDTRVTVTGLIDEEFAGHMDPVKFDGNDRYTLHIVGAYMGVRNGTGRNAFTEELLSGGFISYEDYLFTFDSGSTSVPTTPSTPSSSSFSDVPANAYYAAPVAWAVSNNITNGTSNTTFTPDRTCTTAEILTFLYRTMRGSGTTSAGDMDEAVKWAKEEGMIDSTFNGSTPCTRYTAVSYMWQAFGRHYHGGVTSFSDVTNYSTMAMAVAWAVSQGITNGTSSTTFSPNDICTRGQIVTLLYRAANA